MEGVGDDEREHASVREKAGRRRAGYEQENVTKNVLIAVDEVQRVVKSLDEPLGARSLRHYASVLRPIGKTRWAHGLES